MKNIWKSPVAGAATIILLTVGAYIPAIRGGFIWDDDILVTDNRLVKANDGLYRVWFSTESFDYWPLTSSVWWLEWRMWGDRPMGYHVVNVLLHAANAILVWLILQRLKIPGAWLAGLIFAVHPVNVDTVAWIAELKNTLSMFFYASAILLYLGFDDTGRWRWYGLSLEAFLFALLSKTGVIMLPMVLLGCLWWLHGRVSLKDLRRTAPFFVLSLVLGFVTLWFQHHRIARGFTVPTTGFPTRLAAAGWTPWFYLYKALLPVNLSVVYPKWDTGATRWDSYLPGVLLVGSFALFWWKRRTWGRPALFALGYFVVTLFPVLGFFNQDFHRLSLVADHWQYQSVIGVIALAVAAGAAVVNRVGWRDRYLGVSAIVAVLVILGVATWKRADVYGDSQTLWQDAIIKNPSAWIAHNNLGLALWRQGRSAEGIAQYEQALQIKSDYAEAHYNLGAALQQGGRLPEAIGHYELAVRINPNYGEAHNNLGIALVQTGRIGEGIAQYEAALRVKPDYAAAHNNMAVALKQTGRFREAIGHYEQALRIDPDYAAAYNNLAWLLATITPAEGGDPVRAVPLARRACELTGNKMAGFVDTLAIAYAAAGRFNDAIAAAQKAIELARAAGQTQAVREIETRLELYRVGWTHF